MVDRLKQHPHTYLGLMLALTFSTGVIDAVGYLGLDRVFTGNMTGNVVILGMAIAGANGLPVLGPALALFAFMAGAALGGRVLRGARDGWSGRHTILLAAVSTILAATAVTAFVLDTPLRNQAMLMTSAMGLAMGVQAAAARHIGVKDITTVVVTSTITGLAADSVLGRNVAQPWRRRAGAIFFIAAGAAVGGLALRAHLGWGLLASAVITLAVVIIGHAVRPRLPEAERVGG